MKIVVFGLSVTSSWGNGHATTYRALLTGLRRRGHQIIFFEKNEEWYASNRDLPNPEFCRVHLFENWRSVLGAARRELADCDVAVVGSYFADGIQAANEIASSRAPVKAFYDIDTPVTVSSLQAGGAPYLRPEQVNIFDLYLSFTGGPILAHLESKFGARRAVPCYCSFEPKVYYPRGRFCRYDCDLSYMGTYAADRQAKLDELFIGTARALPEKRFLLAGPQYPASVKCPANIRRIRHLSPRWHPHFYSSSRLTLNLTRKQMVNWGYSPSVRLFEAAACGCAIVSDAWPGLESFFSVGEEILLAESGRDVVTLLTEAGDSELRKVGEAARARVIEEHSSERRAEEFEKHVSQASAGNLRVSAASVLTASPSRASIEPTAQPIS